MAGTPSWPARIRGRSSPSRAVLVLSLELDPGFRWQPGQYVELLVPGVAGVERRPYSVATAPDPARPGCFEVAIGIPDDEALPEVITRGDTVEVSGPRGALTYRPGVAGPIAFLAAGTGFAPFRAILQHELAHRGGAPTRLVWGVRSERDVPWREELDSWARAGAGFEYSLVYSRGSGPSPARTGYVQQHIEELLAPAPPELVYLCGGSAMVASCRAVLEGPLGLARAAIVTEQYG